MRNIEKPDDSPAISTNVVIGVPVFIVIIVFSLVVRVIVSVLVERVLDAFVEALFGGIWPVRAFRPRNGVMETEIVEKRWEIVRMVFDIELLVEKVLNLLFLPRLALTEAFNKLFGSIESP